MSSNIKTSLIERSESVTDPHIESTRRHKLLDILTIEICAMIRRITLMFTAQIETSRIGIKTRCQQRRMRCNLSG